MEGRRRAPLCEMRGEGEVVRAARWESRCVYKKGIEGGGKGRDRRGCRCRTLSDRIGKRPKDGATAQSFRFTGPQHPVSIRVTVFFKSFELQI